MSRAKHRAAKLGSGESLGTQFLVNIAGPYHDSPTFWTTFFFSLIFPRRAALNTAGIPSRPHNLFGGINGRRIALPGASLPIVSSNRKRLEFANQVRERIENAVYPKTLRRLSPRQALFVELILIEFEKSLDSGNAGFFREMASALETINQGRFADQPRLLVFLHCFDLVDGKPVRKTGITTRGIKALLKKHGVIVSETQIHRMAKDLGVVKDSTPGMPKKTPEAG